MFVIMISLNHLYSILAYLEVVKYPLSDITKMLIYIIYLIYTIAVFKFENYLRVYLF